MMSILRRIQGLLYLADLAAADYIVSVRRLKEAERRINQFERDNTHMCLRPGCDRPVAGKSAFTHCELHLTQIEQGWVKGGDEPAGFPARKDSPFGKLFAEINVDSACKAVKRKEEALREAYATSRAFWDTRRERNRLVPDHLSQRLSEYEADLIDVDAMDDQ